MELMEPLTESRSLQKYIVSAYETVPPNNFCIWWSATL